jgi:hypothetical protein
MAIYKEDGKGGYILVEPDITTNDKKKVIEQKIKEMAIEVPNCDVTALELAANLEPIEEVVLQKLTDSFEEE